ncbi:MAG: hypothetical protein DBX59_10445 [Bacillota bacterium]|nr:MAG: hypothetical protein DBX59_10445 [Bacillota bacterium]
MNENKLKRLVVAATATAVILLVILVSVLVYQLAAINREQSLRNEYDAAIAELEQMIDDNESIIAIKKQRWYIEKIARELGYYYPDDVGQ